MICKYIFIDTQLNDQTVLFQTIQSITQSAGAVEYTDFISIDG